MNDRPGTITDERARSSAAGRREARAAMPEELRRDVRRLGELLGRVILEQGGEELLADVEGLRTSAISMREDSGHPVTELGDEVEALPLERVELVVRAFTLYFHLVGLAEHQHRIRSVRQRGRAAEPVEDSLAAAVEQVRADDGDEALRALVDRLEVTPVLTAHPTEARRRSVQEALHGISLQLDRLDGERLSSSEAADAQRRILEGIDALWLTDPLRHTQPTPLDEVRGVMTAFDETLFRVLPVVYRELDRALGPGDVGCRPPPFDPFLRWASWIGGDRDGNPTVTANVTRRALEIHEQHILRGLEAATRRIARSLTPADDAAPPASELLRTLAEDERLLPEAAAAYRNQVPEQPHRRKMLLSAYRLEATRSGGAAAYPHAGVFIDDLRTVQGSLAQAGATRLAYGELQHLLWQAQTFGFHLASLEVRQHSGVHERALAELEVGMDPDGLDRLAGGGARPVGPEVSAETQEVLETLRAMHEIQGRYGPEACRRYVVSFTRSAADIVAVRALAGLAVPDGTLELDVVPLFESREDLERAVPVLEQTMQLPCMATWLDARGREMEAMLGYSDSAKDAGFLAGNIALHRAQADLSEWARSRDISLRLFHGRGGALGRGGGPMSHAIKGQAPGSVASRFKVTEQGEVIFERYGRIEIAARHLEQVTGAVLSASSPSGERRAEEPLRRYAETTERMGRVSERAYRELVEQPGFVEFFGAVTPIDVIEQMRLGSRPARRGGGRQLESLRAIPWVFSWSQTRCNLPGWFGIGSALAAETERPEGIALMREMYRTWPFFTSLLESVEMSLARTDWVTARRYLESGDRPEIVDAIGEEHERAERMVLQVSEQDRLLARRPVERYAIDLRTPYIDVLSTIQLRVLRELREDGATDRPRLERLAMLTVDGTAAGLQTTG